MLIGTGHTARNCPQRHQNQNTTIIIPNKEPEGHQAEEDDASVVYPKSPLEDPAEA